MGVTRVSVCQSVAAFPARSNRFFHLLVAAKFSSSTIRKVKHALVLAAAVCFWVKFENFYWRQVNQSSQPTTVSLN